MKMIYITELPILEEPVRRTPCRSAASPPPSGSLMLLQFSRGGFVRCNGLLGGEQTDAHCSPGFLKIFHRWLRRYSMPPTPNIPQTSPTLKAKESNQSHSSLLR